VTVADLSSLWAGPLCTGLLAQGGAEVTKVESRTRPDGARRASRRFWRLLNGAKAEMRVELGQLRDAIEAADVVVLGSRRRAYEQLGIDVDEVLAARSDKVVVAITGHGWHDDRVGFGDDAAVAGGLVALHPDDGEPRFLADAVADPVAGLHAAVAAARSVVEGGRWFVDVSLAGVSAALAPGAGTDRPAVAATRWRRGWVLDDEPVAPPRARACPS
jgi:crotonobetainyl-CoA:carnitine CoA-transferase CaiB-like acyl-CoA transferase